MVCNLLGLRQLFENDRCGGGEWAPRTTVHSLIFSKSVCKFLEFVSAMCEIMWNYGMFHVTWTTFKFNRNQLGTVSVYVMSSVP